MRILLVEDEAPLRETLAARLKREGYAVDAAQDGEEGLYMGREVPFDVGRTRSTASSRAPTTTWSSLSTSKSCWPASTRWCGARPAGASPRWNAAR